jgi:hypothetical protein
VPIVPKLTVESPKAPVAPSPVQAPVPSASLEVSAGSQGPAPTTRSSSAPSAAAPGGPTSTAGPPATSTLGIHAANVRTRPGVVGRHARSASVRPTNLPGSGEGATTHIPASPGANIAALSRDPFGARALMPASDLQVLPADTRAAGPSSGVNLFGMNLGPAARDSLTLALLIFGTGAFMLGLLFADGLGLGPRHPLWRRRFTSGLRRRLHWWPSTSDHLRPFRRRM